MFCQTPLMIGKLKVPCGTCDHCVAVRIGHWCGRALMEKQTTGSCVVLALTYAEKDDHTRRSARMFDYKDVQDFMRNLRRQVEYHLEQTSVVSFLAAGEKGDRNGRCHWHLVLFSEIDVLQFGEWKAVFGPVIDRRNKITPPGKPGRNREWSLWPHGFVVAQDADYGGVRYAISYALKEQFNARNTKGTGREAKSETFAAGYFTQSKKPPIGWRFVQQHLAECRAGGYVPPRRGLRVEGLIKPFWPVGTLGKALLDGYAEINKEVLDKTGRNAVGWASLIEDCKASATSLEALGMADEQEEEKEASRSATANLRLSDFAKWPEWHAARKQREREISFPDWSSRKPEETLDAYQARLDRAAYAQARSAGHDPEKEDGK